MTLQLRVAAPADLERLRPLLDNEFIFGKGRKVSLANRFPSAFCAANAANIFLAMEGVQIVSACMAKRFEWLIQGKAWRGAMIGAVYTDPQRRGQGHGGKLLQWGTQQLREADVQFGVLWTTQHAFYARLGWTAADTGVLGSSQGEEGASAACPPPESIRSMPLALSDERKIDMLRQRWLDAFVRREPLDYHQVPVPAEDVDVLLWMQGRDPAAYALVGRKGDTGIVYEMVGDADGQDAFAALWSAIRARYRNIVINDRAGSPAQAWLARQPGLTWENKALAMWRPLAHGPEMAEMAQWHIPYFDRI